MAILKQNSLEFTSNSVAQTERLGVRLGQLLQQHDVVCLIGEMGTGKTALTRGVGRGWGTALRVTSPTFTLVNEYPRAQDGRTLYHLDCYRLETAADVDTLGLEDILDRDGAIIIEWAERVEDWLPQDHLQIELTYLNNTRRSLRVTAAGPRSQALLDAFKRAAFGA